ncbi:unnamed protein product [Urochloa decumbens]|uniref:Uncharacterized protein n=1 Tax=Urochloa decumbens TaxID=240449 RepID=A0ABC8XIV9_9POAL
MSEHLALRSSVGSRSSALPSHHHQRLPPAPDPLASVWIRRLHLTPNPPPPPRPPPPPAPLHLRLPRRATPPSHQDAVSTDESRTPPPPPPPPRSAGFGPFRWSPRPLRGAPAGAWDAGASGASTGGSGSGGGPPMMSPFFRLPAPPPPPVTPVAEFGEVAPVRPLIGLGSHSGSSGFPGLSPPMVGGGDARTTWLMGRAAGAAYPSHALDMVPIRTLNDMHDRQHGVIPVPPNLARHEPSSSSQHDEPFSYWNMGRIRRNTTTSSITPISVAPANFGMKRNADSNSFLPLKLRKLSRAI